VKVVRPPFDVNTRARSLPGPVDDPDLVESVALDLLSEFDDDEVRKLGVRVSKLSFSGGDQSRLDGWEDGDDRAGVGPATATATVTVTDPGDDGPTTLADFGGESRDGEDSGGGPDRVAPDGQSSLGDFG
jgi:DNA polymerase IV (DinB-like DNA polymerase)